MAVHGWSRGGKRLGPRQSEWLGLFSLGIKDIRIGPKAPEFLTPGVLNFLQDTFNLKLIGDAQEDLAEMLAV
jgi:hydroxylamine reductase